ncbi:uncharacterized protein [Aristolochia californica]|uniref:uncharacterized protein n=1 Tax=Aristolochia californica TaxID=171875 RepID=UPI0035DF459F
MELKKRNAAEEVKSTGLLIHSQVRKIKQEDEKIEDYSLTEAEIRRALREITRQISRSPLGMTRQPISVGDS